MIKKLLLTSAALISLAGITYAYDIDDISNPFYPDVYYGATYAPDDKSNKPGTITESSNFSSINFDKSTGLFTITENYKITRKNVTQAYHLTPTSFNTNALELRNWNDNSSLNGQFVDETGSQISTGSFYKAGTLGKPATFTDNDSYKEYCRIISSYESLVGPRELLNTIESFYSGQALIDLEITTTPAGKKINKYFYYLVEMDSEDGSVINITQVAMINYTKKTQENNSNCVIAYQVTNIPAGFITSRVSSLYISSTVTSIADNAFDNASNLVRIESGSGTYPAGESDQYGYTFLFKQVGESRTLIFAPKTASSVKAHETDFEDDITAYTTNAFKYHYNLTINSYKLANATLINNNKIVNKSTGAVLNSKTKTTEHGTVKYLEVSGNVNQTELIKVINESWGYQYVLFASEANIQSDLNIDDAISSNNTANSTSWKSSDHNTIYFVANRNGHTVTGTNVVYGTSNGTCENFELYETGDIFYNPYKFTADQATLHRSIGAEYGTICLPYSTTGLSTKFRFGHLASFDESTNVFTFTVDTDMSAYTPSIIKTNNGSSVAFPVAYGVDICVTPLSKIEATCSVADATFVGTMSTETLDSNSSSVNYYGFSSKTGAIVRAAGAKIKTFRAYMTGPKSSYSAAGGLRVIDYAGNEFDFVDFEEDSTAIENISEDGDSDIIYNLNGQNVNDVANDGVYIINGKKTLKK